jgi:hypothetical protein
VTTVIALFGMMCTLPSTSRSTVVRRLTASTSPHIPAAVTTSPTRI